MAAQEAEAEALVVVQGAQRTLAEARKQIAQHRLRRGSYWPQGKGPQAWGNYGAKGGGKSKGKGQSKSSFTRPPKPGPSAAAASGGTGTGRNGQCFRCGG